MSLKHALKAVTEARKLLASTLAKKGHRFDTYFYGDDSGDWVASGAIFGFQKQWDWEMAPSLSSKNDWRNFSVEGATENNAGFRKALKAIVADYPEVADFWLSFDGPMKPVRDVLGLSDSDSWDGLVFLHGTSTTFLPTIEKNGLRPRGQTSVKPAYGHGSNAKPSNPDLLYFTTQETMAKFAARAAAAVHGGEPVILEVRNLDKAKAEPDEDSREKTAEASLARMGSIGYRGRVSASQVKARRPLAASARLVLASYVSAGEIFTDETGKFWGNQGAGGVFLAEDTGRILIQKRSPHVNEPNTWGTFGGKIDDGEDPKQAMEREIEEESSYHGPKKVKLVYTFQDGKFKFHNYLITVPHEFEPKHSWETSDHAWVTLDDLPSPLHFGFKSFLPHLKRELGHKLAASASKDVEKIARAVLRKQGFCNLECVAHSIALRDALRANGFPQAERVYGHVMVDGNWRDKWGSGPVDWASEDETVEQDMDHNWVEVDGLVVDIGAEQFNPLLKGAKFPPVYIAPMAQARRHVGEEIIKASKLAAKSFSDVDIPRDFRVMFFMPNEKVPTLGAQLARRQLEGVTGITDSGQVLMLRMLGANRNAMLVMPGEQTAKLNKLSRIMYENPEYWMSKDMAALIRVYGGSTDREAAINRIFQAAEKTPSKNFMRAVSSLDLFPSAFPATPVNTVKDLAKQWFEVAKPLLLNKLARNDMKPTLDPAAWDEWARDRYAPMVDLGTYEKAITDALHVIAKTFVWEGEWLLKDKTLRIPPGARLFITKPKSPYDQARFKAQQALITEHGLDKVYKIVWVDGEKLQQTAMKYGMTAADKLVKQRLPAFESQATG